MGQFLGFHELLHILFGIQPEEVLFFSYWVIDVGFEDLFGAWEDGGVEEAVKFLGGRILSDEILEVKTSFG